MRLLVAGEPVPERSRSAMAGRTVASAGVIVELASPATNSLT